MHTIKGNDYCCPQACRGNTLDHGRDIEEEEVADSPTPERIPVESDFLIAHSTVDGRKNLIIPLRNFPWI